MIKNVNAFGKARDFYVEMVRSGLRYYFMIPARTLIEAERKFIRRNLKQIKFISYRVVRDENDLPRNFPCFALPKENSWDMEVLEQKVERLVHLMGGGK